MKAFAIFTAFALACGISADDSIADSSQRNYPPGSLLSKEPFELNGIQTKLEIKFRDLQLYYYSTGSDPLNTFIVHLLTQTSQRDKQNLLFDFTNMRKVVPDLPLSISGCDGMGVKCYPEYLDPKVPRPFKAINNTDTNATLNTQFAGNRPSFYVYLQIQNTPGKDNDARPAFPDHGANPSTNAAYNKIIGYNNSDETAFSITLI